MNPYQAVSDFEGMIAEYAGSKYAVAVESGSAAIFLSLMWAKHRMAKGAAKARGMGRKWKGNGKLGEITIPKHTYPSVPCSIKHAGGRVKFSDDLWSGIYQLQPYLIYDGALRFQRKMYAGGLHCLSFHVKKHLPIGRGGMILLNDPMANDWLRRARFDGRGEMPLMNDDFTMLGWNMYMTPEQAIRGIQLFQPVKDKDFADLLVPEQGYPDLSKFKVYQR